jgi:hypothetical protein
MGNPIQEYYLGNVIVAASPLKIGSRLHGILSIAAGTITVALPDGTVILNAMPTVAGYNKIALASHFTDGYTVTSSSNGVLLV